MVKKSILFVTLPLLLVCFILPGIYTRVLETCSNTAVETITRDSLYAAEYLEKGIRNYQKARYDSSLVFLKQAAKIFKQENTREQVVNCYNWIAENLLKQGKYDETLDSLNKFDKISPVVLNKNTIIAAHHSRLIGQIYTISKDYNRAHHFLNQAIYIISKSPGKNPEERASCYNSLGDFYFGRYKLDSAYACYKKALDILQSSFDRNHPDLAGSFMRIGDIHYSQGDFDKAFASYETALLIFKKCRIKDHPDVASCYNKLGTAYRTYDDLDKALQNYNTALSINQKIFGPNHPENIQIYINICHIYKRREEFDRALEYLNQALFICQNAEDTKNDNLLSIYENYGLLYLLKNEFHRALQYFNVALKIYQKSENRVVPKLAMLYSHIGYTYFLINQPDEAIKFEQKSVDIAQQFMEPDHIFLSRPYKIMGYAYIEKGISDKAWDHLEKSLAIEIHNLGEKHIYVSNSYSGMAKSCLEEGKTIKALHMIQKAIISCVYDYNNQDLYSSPPLNHIHSENVLLYALMVKANIFLHIYLEQSKNRTDLKMALSTYELANTLIERVRFTIKSETSQILCTEKYFRLYQEAVYTAYLLYHMNRDNVYVEKAFEFAEKSKLRSLNMAINDARAKLSSNIPENILKNEKTLRTELAEAEKRMYEVCWEKTVHDSMQITFWQNKCFTLGREYDDIIARLEKKYPEYYNLKYQNKTVTVQEIRENILEENNALVEYFLGDSLLYIFTVTQNNLDVVQLKIDSDFENLVQNLRSGLIDEDYALYSKTAYQLYQKLIQPVEEKIRGRDLFIIPDGILCYLPFEALIKEKPEKDSEDYSRLAYLIKDYQISYGYSATLLYENMIQKHRKSPKVTYMGFAPEVNK